MSKKRIILPVIAVMLVLVMAVGLLVACDPDPVNYTLTFNHGDGSTTTLTVPDGTALTADQIPAYVPAHDYDVFGGWHIGETGVSAGFVVSADASVDAVVSNALAATFDRPTGFGYGDKYVLSEDGSAVFHDYFESEEDASFDYDNTKDGTWSYADGAVTIVYGEDDVTVLAVLENCNVLVNGEAGGWTYIKVGYTVDDHTSDFLGYWTAENSFVYVTADADGILLVVDGELLFMPQINYNGTEITHWGMEGKVAFTVDGDSLVATTYSYEDGAVLGTNLYSKGDVSSLAPVVTFMANGEVVAKVNVAFGGYLSEEDLPTAPADPDGGVFAGWLDANGWNMDLFAAIYGDVTYTASYETPIVAIDLPEDLQGWDGEYLGPDFTFYFYEDGTALYVTEWGETSFIPTAWDEETFVLTLTNEYGSQFLFIANEDGTASLSIYGEVVDLIFPCPFEIPEVLVGEWWTATSGDHIIITANYIVVNDEYAAWYSDSFWAEWDEIVIIYGGYYYGFAVTEDGNYFGWYNSNFNLRQAELLVDEAPEKPAPADNSFPEDMQGTWYTSEDGVEVVITADGVTVGGVAGTDLSAEESLGGVNYYFSIDGVEYGVYFGDDGKLYLGKVNSYGYVVDADELVAEYNAGEDNGDNGEDNPTVDGIPAEFLALAGTYRDEDGTFVVVISADCIADCSDAEYPSNLNVSEYDEATHTLYLVDDYNQYYNIVNNGDGTITYNAYLLSSGNYYYTVVLTADAE